MSVAEKIFNLEIQSFLKLDENASYSQTILVIQKIYSDYGCNYYRMFDDLCCKAGIEFILEEVEDVKIHRKGYKPKFVFLEDNKINETPQTLELTFFSDLPLTLEESYRLFAKEVVSLFLSKTKFLNDVRCEFLKNK